VGVHALQRRLRPEQHSPGGPCQRGRALFSLDCRAALARLLSIIGWKRLAVTGLCLAAWRALEQIPVSSLIPGQINARLQAADTSTVLHIIGNAIPFAAYSLAALGVQPYINALIVVTLFRVISARLRAIQKAPDGRVRLLRWTRALTVLLAMGQAYGWTSLYELGSVLPPMDWSARLVIMLELTGGTMVLVFLGDILDEFGLGLGNGAILIYALGSLASEVHRLAAIAASSPSLDALYRPLGVWVIFSISVVAATVALLLAVRRVSPPTEGKKSRTVKLVELRILLSGVLRPPLFATAVLFLPVIFANYFARTNPGASAWIANHMTAYGANPWTDAAYTVVDACLVIGFTYFVVISDFRDAPREVTGPINRLTFIGGAFLALTVVVLPVLEWNVSRAAGHGIGMSGFDAVLVATMIVFIVRSLEQSRKLVAGPPVLMSQVP
jgi:preprotein translocase subunit SecY